MSKGSISKIFHLDQAKIVDWLNTHVKEAVKDVFQEIIKEEAAEVLRAEPYERNVERTDLRNGVRKRKLKTRVGEIELDMPRFRVIPFQSKVIDRYKRMEISLEEALIEMYFQGVSTARVTDISEALCGLPVSASKQSRLNKTVYTKLDNWRNRKIDGVYRYLHLDGIVISGRLAGEVKNISILVAVGVKNDGSRQIIGVSEGLKEDESSWKNFLKGIRERGLADVELIIADHHLGIQAAIREVYPKASYQRCIFHFIGNVTSKVSRSKTKLISSAFKSIYEQESKTEALAKFERVKEIYKKELERATQTLAGFENTITYFNYPQTHWVKIRTNNPLERLLKEVRRRTNVVGAFPDIDSALMLVTARLKYQEEKKWNKRNYLSFEDEAMVNTINY